MAQAQTTDAPANTIDLFGLAINIDQLLAVGLNLIGAFSILILGVIASGWLAGFVRRSVERSPRFDKTLGFVFANIARWAVLAFTIVAVLNRFGIQTTSIVALLGAAGLAIGLALQGTLSNIASGVMLLGLRPFKVGDFVEIGGTSGIVDEIGLFTTKMHTPDNLGIHMPNSSIWGQQIKNFAQHPTRRIDLVFGIGYTDDIGHAIDVIKDVLEADERILSEPAYRVGVTALGESSVNLLVWPWVNRADFLDVKLDLLRTIKERFDAEGISIPFPQRDVHVYQDEPFKHVNTERLKEAAD